MSQDDRLEHDDSEKAINPRWAEGRARHAQVAPDLQAFQELLFRYVDTNGLTMAGQIYWADRGAAEMDTLCTYQATGATQGPDWVSLAAMRGVVCPKFSFITNDDELDSKGRPDIEDAKERNLFGTVICNESSDERVGLAYTSLVRLPPHSGFLLSDIKHLRPLLQGGPRFKCIVIDPPWENRSVKRSRQYEMLPSKNLLGLPLAQLMNPEECLVALWVTNREKLRRFVDQELLPFWGLHCVAKWHWLKIMQSGQPISPLGAHHRRPYETLLLCRPLNSEGDVQRYGPADPPDGRVISCVPLEHSRKPHLGPLLQKFVSPPHDQYCLEMFARELFPGWFSWGNEVLKFQVIESD